MRVLLYARKSTDEHQLESIETQLDSGRAYCAAKGWEVVLEITDTASGGEWARRRRPGIFRVLDEARAGSFEIVVTRDDSRIGRDMLRAPLFLSDLFEAGAKVLCYDNHEELRVDDSTSRLLTTLKAWKSEGERVSTSSRTREALARLASNGHVAGGRVFGYRNVRGLEGVDRVLDPAEAAIVVEIWERYANGEGLRRVCKALTTRGVLSPRGGAWVPSALHEMLRRELYRGVITWGAAAKVYRGGTRTRTMTHERSRVTRIAPELRIVSEELWHRVQARIVGQTRGGAQPRAGAPARYLLSGILRCAECGGPITVCPGRAGATPIRVYSCGHHRDRGTCPSTLRREVGAVDQAVLDWVSREVFTEAVILRALTRLRERVAREASERAGEREQLGAEVRRLRDAVARLADAASEAPPVARDALFARLTERQRELVGAEDRLRVANLVTPAVVSELGRLEAEARATLAALREATQAAPIEARALLMHLFPAGLEARREATPGGVRMAISGAAHPGALCGNRASPAGSETIRIEVAV